MVVRGVLVSNRQLVVAVLGDGQGRSWHGIYRGVGDDKAERLVDRIGFIEKLKPDNELPGPVILTLARTK